MFTCTECKMQTCTQENKEAMPKNCPMRVEGLSEMVMQEYSKVETKRFINGASKIESLGYCVWSRVRETIEFCKEMNYQKVGVAFCVGLSKEAKVFTDLLKKHGLESVSVICKNGGISKEEMGIDKDYKLKPDAYETACNPIGQAMLLNRANTDFNVVIGLCVGHDSLFFKNSNAPATVLVTKDRRLAHNPAGALYCAEGYYKNKL